MKTQDLVLGSKIEIHIVQLYQNGDEEKKDNGVFFSTIQDIYDDGTIEMMMPMADGKLQNLSPKLRYEFLFFQPNGLYKAQGSILESYKKGNFYLTHIELQAELQKFQRREFYRLECLIPMMFMALDEEAFACNTILELKNYMNENVEFKVRGIGTILDISGGGARFVTTNSLENISYILLQFSITRDNGSFPMEIPGKLVRTEKMPDENKFIHRVHFNFKGDDLQQKIIGFIFEEERRIRKKEQGI